MPDAEAAPESRMAGVQPLDGLMVTHALTNRDLVDVSIKTLTFKMVQKGRKGRRLTRRIQLRLTEALNAKVEDARYRVDDLFTYRGS